MTIQKALEVIKNEVSYKSGIIINQALKTVESAVGKQIPRKPDKRKEHKQNDYYCAVCRYYLGDEMELKFAGLQPKFCPSCGQALDWSENDE